MYTTLVFIQYCTAILQACLNSADRALGFWLISSELGFTTRLSHFHGNNWLCTISGVTRDSCVRARLVLNTWYTMLCSKLWKEMTAQIPLGFNNTCATFSPLYSWFNSSLTNIRRAWNVNVAGCCFAPSEFVRSGTSSSLHRTKCAEHSLVSYMHEKTTPNIA